MAGHGTSNDRGKISDTPNNRQKKQMIKNGKLKEFMMEIRICTPSVIVIAYC